MNGDGTGGTILKGEFGDGIDLIRDEDDFCCSGWDGTGQFCLGRDGTGRLGYYFFGTGQDGIYFRTG